MIQLEHKSDLIALHRAIMEAKFHDPPSNEEVLTSPILSRISNAILDDIVDIERREARSQQVDSWRRWRDVGARPEIVKLVIECARQSPHWAKMTREDKGDYIRCGLSPILAAPDELALLVDEVEKVRG